MSISDYTHIGVNTYAKPRFGTINDRQKRIIGQATDMAIGAIDRTIRNLGLFSLILRSLNDEKKYKTSFTQNSMYLNLKETGYFFLSDKNNTLTFMKEICDELSKNFQILSIAFARRIELVELCRDEQGTVKDAKGNSGRVVGYVNNYKKEKNLDCLSISEFKRGRIHIRFPTPEEVTGSKHRQMTAPYLALTIIHEASHKYLGTNDTLGYCNDKHVLDVKGILPEVRLKNADQLACFAMYFN